MSEHFNKLTPAQAERLAMLIEEAGEVIQAAGKILRHGYSNYHPDTPHITNRETLLREVTDFIAVFEQVEAKDLSPLTYSPGDAALAWQKKLKFARHQKGGGDE